MKKPYLIFLLLFLYSCSEDCEGIDCLSQDSFSSTIKSAKTGDDLIFGHEPQIPLEEVEVFYFLNGSKQTAFVRSEINYILVPFNREVKEYFVKALEKTDTLNIDFFRTDGSKCCPSTTQVKGIQVNGKVVEDDIWHVVTLSR